MPDWHDALAEFMALEFPIPNESQELNQHD